MRAVLSLIPACVIFAACLRLHTAERGKLLLIVGAFALVNAVLGIAQLATGGSMTPYPSSHLGYPIGLFVNRNHNAVFLLLAMPVVAALAARRMQGADSKIPYIVGTLALLTIIASRPSRRLRAWRLRSSRWRSSDRLRCCFFASPSCGSRFPRRSRSERSPRPFRGSAASIAMSRASPRCTTGASIIGTTSRGRFITMASPAPASEASCRFIRRPKAFRGISPAILNHAHNDFIEIVLEGGVPAIALLLAFFALFARRGDQVDAQALRPQPRLARPGGGDRNHARAVLLAGRLSAADAGDQLHLCNALRLLPSDSDCGRARKGSRACEWRRRLGPFARLAGARACAIAALFVLQAGASASTCFPTIIRARAWAPGRRARTKPSRPTRSGLRIRAGRCGSARCAATLADRCDRRSHRGRCPNLGGSAARGN